MKTRFTLLLFIVLLTHPYLFAQKRTVAECSNKRPIKDSVLQNALQQSTVTHSSIEFLTEDLPCAHTKRIVNALNRTINKQWFSLAIRHSFSLIRNGENSFSIERFIFKNKQTAALIGKILKTRSTNTLQIESFTLYDFFLIENNLILFIADRESYQFNKPLFNEIEENFRAEYKLNQKSLKTGGPRQISLAVDQTSRRSTSRVLGNCHQYKHERQSGWAGDPLALRMEHPHEQTRRHH